LKIFVSKVEEIKQNKELKFEPTPGFGKYRPLFPEKAVEHPAKMNTNLLEFLIERYTKEGEVILDPLAGTGSTGILAALHNRNAILVELEKKFVDWIVQAKEKVQTLPTLAPKGEIKVIQGDSRKLSELLKDGQTDAIITSPPYADQMNAGSKGGTISPHMQGLISKLSGIPVKEFANNPKRFMEAWKIARSKIPHKYSDSPDNIGNLPLGNVDAIITSPPYANSAQDSNKSPAITKPPRPNDIRQSVRKPPINRYSDNPNNIGNLPIGNIDAIITSPPYEGSTLSGGDPERRKERLLKAGYNPKDFLGGKARNAVLKHYDEVDAIITSPPYTNSAAENLNVSRYRKGGKFAEEKLEEIDTIITSPPYAEANRGGGIAQKGYEGKYGKDDKLHLRHDRPLSNNPENISNLHYGVDAVITSPPYEDTMGEKRHATPNTGGAEKLSKEKHLGWYPTTPSNIGSMKKETYLQAMLQVYKEMYNVLKKGGRAIIVVKPFTRNKKVIDLPYHTWLLLEKVGFQLEDVWKLYLKNLSFWRLNQYKKNPEQEQIRHEYILVVKK